MFSSDYEIHVDGRKGGISILGGILSLISILLIAFYIIFYMVKTFERKNPIYSFLQFNDNSLEFNLDKNYGIYYRKIQY